MLIRHDISPENYLADETDYPAVFPLFDNGKMKDGVATPIDSKWAVTAAHCAVDLYKKDFENHPFFVKIGGKENIIILKMYCRWKVSTGREIAAVRL
jgi:hypothetical protein